MACLSVSQAWPCIASGIRLDQECSAGVAGDLAGDFDGDMLFGGSQVKTK